MIGAFNCVVGLPALLAQRGSVVDMGRKFRSDNGGLQTSEIVTLVLLVVVVALAGWVLSRYLNAQDRPGYNSPRRLFRELCKSHQLDRRSRRLLKRLANFHELESPAALFLTPECFDVRLLDETLQPQSARIEKLRDALFGRRVKGEG